MMAAFMLCWVLFIAVFIAMMSPRTLGRWLRDVKRGMEE